MLNMAKKLAKALKAATRPHNAKPAVSYSNVPAKVLVMPKREELTVDAKIKAFTDAVEAYPSRPVVDEWLDSDDATVPAEIENLVFSLEALDCYNCTDW